LVKALDTHTLIEHRGNSIQWNAETVRHAHGGD
jgi:hypothetical protein